MTQADYFHARLVSLSRYFVISFGVLFFVVHLAWMLYSLPYARDRDTRLELIGKIVPGFARLCIAGSVLIPSPVHSIALVVVASPILVVGRACYELLVFRGNAR